MPDDEQANTRERALRRLRPQKEDVDRICATSSHGSTAMLPEAAAELYNEALDLLMDASVDLEPGLRIRADEIQRGTRRATPVSRPLCFGRDLTG